jgi:hypothetical protein
MFNDSGRRPPGSLTRTSKRASLLSPDDIREGVILGATTLVAAAVGLYLYLKE